MPVYNGERFVRESLDSWLAQDFRDFELIVSDNASTDETPAILEEYASRDSRIRILRQPSTVIAYENFNLLVKEASAPYFTWAACDDLRDETFLSRMLEALDTYPDRALAYCNPRYFGDRQRLRSHHPTASVDPPGTENTPLARCIALLRVSGWLPVYGVYRLDVLKRSHLFFYPMGVAADVMLVIEVASFGKLHCVPETLMSTRLHKDSLSLDLSDPIHAGRVGRRFDKGVQDFIDGMPLSEIERRLFKREMRVYCRKAHKPRHGLWKSGGFRSLYVRSARALIDLERLLRGL